MITTASNWPRFRESSSNKKTKVLRSKSTGMTPQWMIFSDSATISLPQTFAAAGSVSTAMPVKKPLVKDSSVTDASFEELDEIDAEIARMSDKEIIAAVLASAGSWADRDDLDFILDRSDRIDELYASDTPDKPDSSI